MDGWPVLAGCGSGGDWLELVRHWDPGGGVGTRQGSRVELERLAVLGRCGFAGNDDRLGSFETGFVEGTMSACRGAWSHVTTEVVAFRFYRPSMRFRAVVPCRKVVRLAQEGCC